MMNMNAMPMMGGMMQQPMMGGMMMPMMMPSMMMNMTCEMMGNTMVCKMTPMGGMTTAMMKECCDSMNRMMAMGMPMMMACGNMMMCCMPAETGSKAMGTAKKK